MEQQYGSSYTVPGAQIASSGGGTAQRDSRQRDYIGQQQQPQPQQTTSQYIQQSSTRGAMPMPSSSGHGAIVRPIGIMPPEMPQQHQPLPMRPGSYAQPQLQQYAPPPMPMPGAFGASAYNPTTRNPALQPPAPYLQQPVALGQHTMPHPGYMQASIPLPMPMSMPGPLIPQHPHAQFAMPPIPVMQSPMQHQATGAQYIPPPSTRSSIGMHQPLPMNPPSGPGMGMMPVGRGPIGSTMYIPPPPTAQSSALPSSQSMPPPVGRPQLYSQQPPPPHSSVPSSPFLHQTPSSSFPSTPDTRRLDTHHGHSQPLSPPPHDSAQHQHQHHQQQQQQQQQTQSWPSKPKGPRIDPSQMPRPPKPQRDVTYHTRIASGRKVPPLSNASYIAIDNGNCSPRHMRLTMCAPAVSRDLLTQVGIPFALLATPFAALEEEEEAIPQVNMEGKPLRCTRCKGYINCSVGWTDNGSSWVCNLCGMKNSVPAWYECSLDGSGLRQDRVRRPELVRGSVEFIVDKDYSVRPPQEPIMIIAIDISRYAVQSGTTVASLRAAKNSLAVLQHISSVASPHQPTCSSHYTEGYPGPNTGNNTPSIVRVGIMTYDTSTVHFYSMKQGMPDSLKILVSHSSDPVAALPADAWIWPLEQRMADLHALLDRIPDFFSEADDVQGPTGPTGSLPPSGNYAAGPGPLRPSGPPTGGGTLGARHGPSGPDNKQSSSPSASSGAAISCTGAAIKAAHSALESLGGRVFVLTPCTPSEGVLHVNSRERIPHYGTDAELSMYCSTTVAASLTKDPAEKASLQGFCDAAAECAKACVCVEIILCLGDDASHRDTAVLADLCNTTGGALHCLTGSMLVETNALRVQQQLVHSMKGIVGSDAIVKLRTSLGVNLDRYLAKGHTTPETAAMGEIELAGLDADLSLCCMLKLDATLKDEDKMYVQLAILYTSPTRQRVVRVHNLCAAVSSNATIIFRNADLDAVTTTAVKLAIDRALQQPLSHPTLGAKTMLQDLAIEILHKYRINCSAQSPRGQLILPESLKLLPLYVLGMLKHPAFLENVEGVGLPVMGANGATSRGPNVRAQERAYELRKLLAFPVKQTINSIYPRLFRVDKGPGGEVEEEPLSPEYDQGSQPLSPLPSTVSKPLSAETLRSDAVYILDDASSIYLYVGRAVSQVKLEVSDCLLLNLSLYSFYTPLSHILSLSIHQPTRCHSLTGALRHLCPHSPFSSDISPHLDHRPSHCRHYRYAPKLILPQTRASSHMGRRAFLE